MTDRPLLGLPRPGRPGAMALLALLALPPAACTSSTGEPAGAQAWIRPSARPAAAPPPSSRSAAARPAAARPAAPLAVEALGATYRVTRRAKLRRGPSERDPVLAVLPVGTELQATGRVATGWLEVRHGRVQGFVSAGLVEPAATGGGGDSAELPAEPAAAAGGGTEGGAP